MSIGNHQDIPLIEDSPDLLEKKCTQLATYLTKSRNAIFYTGAGISTAASIPDYRGPAGVWTLAKKSKGSEIGCCDPTKAEPTLSHMAIFELYKRGYIKHVLSQNCDGLHLRSGIPQKSLSEIHGNMYIEICKTCEPMRQYIRPVDVTRKTSFRRHKTENKCDHCAADLHDTIVHFGETGRLAWPLNWQGALDALDYCDLIVCIGSSLQATHSSNASTTVMHATGDKILKKYTFLWCLGRAKKDRPKLVIINLQWTPKDKSSDLKINAKCDRVMQRVCQRMNIPLPPYCRFCDPVFQNYRRNTKNNKSLMHCLSECRCGFAAGVISSLQDLPQPPQDRNDPVHDVITANDVIVTANDVITADDYSYASSSSSVSNSIQGTISAVSLDPECKFDLTTGSSVDSDSAISSKQSDSEPCEPLYESAERGNVTCKKDTDLEQIRDVYPGWWRRGSGPTVVKRKRRRKKKRL